ncbi:MAG: hypothetical protein HY438_04345 [DPANN group archaeon]|nr:hypothetical protein [DPANN group archaeon]
MAKEQTPQVSVSREEQIGFHKGSITTLLKEREEMVKIVTIVDSLLKAHLDALQKLGVNIQVQQQAPQAAKPAKKK